MKAVSIIVVCLAISGAVLFMSSGFMCSSTGSNIQRTVGDIHMLSKAVTKFESETGALSTHLEQLVRSHLKALILDPWGNNYYYREVSKGCCLVSSANSGSFTYIM